MERSSDGTNYTFVGKVMGAGNSVSLLSYEMIDSQPSSGINYYRLKQVDENGEFKYSAIIFVSFEEHPEFSFYPNPLSRDGTLKVSFEKPLGGIFFLSISDLAGKELFAQEFLPENNSNQIAIPHLGLESGVYLIKMQYGYDCKTKRLVIE